MNPKCLISLHGPIFKLIKSIKGLIKRCVQAYCWHLKGWNCDNLMLSSLLQYGTSYITIKFTSMHKSAWLILHFTWCINTKCEGQWLDILNKWHFKNYKLTILSAFLLVWMIQDIIMNKNMSCNNKLSHIFWLLLDTKL